MQRTGCSSIESGPIDLWLVSIHGNPIGFSTSKVGNYTLQVSARHRADMYTTT